MPPHVVRPTTRREMLQVCSAGFGALAFTALAATEANAADNSEAPRPHSPLAARASHFPPRAKRVIFLFMGGGPSAMDTFDPKPRLDRDHGQPLPFKHPVGIIDPEGKLMRSPWQFRQHGQSGTPVSELFPHVAACVDDLCVIRSVHTEGQAHGHAVLKLHTGDAAFVRPSLGSWVLYGLGTENLNLPGFVTISPTLETGGAQLYGNAFLPAVFQGTALGQQDQPAKQAAFPHLSQPGAQSGIQRRQLDYLQELNREFQRKAEDESALEGIIESYELAFRMQMYAPSLLDLSGETKATQDLYGVGQTPTDDFGRQCLLARRFLEQGVRFVQVSHTKWDQHSKLKEEHAQNALEVDQPIAGLLRDLKSRGLLEDTLVIWGGEFGRTPTAQGGDGRDHNPHGFTMWLAGGGVRGGYVHGSTDEFGYYAQSDKVHMHDLHATVLHLLGMDHTRLTYRYGGRDFRLTDVYGNVVREVLA